MLHLVGILFPHRETGHLYRITYKLETTQSSSYFIWDMSGLIDMQQSCYTVPENRNFTRFKRLWTSPLLAPQLKHGDTPLYLLIRELF
jgi:hypothetical protein